MTSEQIEVAKLFTGILTLFATIVVAYFAYTLAARQADTAHFKLQFDLYQKRFDIFQAAETVISAIHMNEDYETITKRSDEFHTLTNHSMFIMPGKTTKFLKDVNNEALEYLVLLLEYSEVNSKKEPKKSGGKTAEELEVMLKKFRSNFIRYDDELLDHFFPMLDFRNLK